MQTQIFKAKGAKNAPCKCLSLPVTDYFVKTKKRYYPQTLGNANMNQKKMKMENLINDDLEKCSSDESDNENDNDSNDETESEDEKDNDESNE